MISVIVGSSPIDFRGSQPRLHAGPARLDGIVRLFGHSAGGRPSERLMARLGMTYGTVIVDLERRQVVDLLADRSAATAADWFKGHPEIEVVSRDRAGLYADAARQGAPQARQIADRFHLLKNFGKPSSGSSGASRRGSGVPCPGGG